MNHEFLQRHKFQLISFIRVCHSEKYNTGKIQINNDSHILHIIKGTAVIHLDEHPYSIKSGDVVSIPPFTPFTMNIAADFEMMNVHYKIWLEDDIPLDSFRKLPVVFAPSYFDVCRTLLAKVIETLNQNLPADPLLHELVLMHFTRTPLHETAVPTADPRMLRVKSFLDKLDFEHFDSEKLAAVACLSKSQMNRSFRKTFGISPLEYHEKQRLKFVCMKLKNSADAVYEIADSAGFHEPGYFCRWFKKMTGNTPSKYRKKLLSLEESL
ncbi:MAG: Arabinose operon regulatory protein [Lentisphaerae bacterium ADurb.Bin242]|nr:MAG: Arabinose operon regulatory protein [Lentisphaerae bacterium ADurb.Bin242]